MAHVCRFCGGVRGVSPMCGQWIGQHLAAPLSNRSVLSESVAGVFLVTVLEVCNLAPVLTDGIRCRSEGRVGSRTPIFPAFAPAPDTDFTSDRSQMLFCYSYQVLTSAGYRRRRFEWCPRNHWSPLRCVCTFVSAAVSRPCPCFLSSGRGRSST